MALPTNGIWKDSEAAALSTGNTAGFGIDTDDGRLYVNRDGTRESMATTYTKVITASTTLTAEDDGVTLILNSTTSIVVTLPATAAGLRFTIVVKGLTSASGHTFTPAAGDYITGNGLTAVDNNSLQCSAATDRIGDFATIVGDGVDGWFIVGISGTWAKV